METTTVTAAKEAKFHNNIIVNLFLKKTIFIVLVITSEPMAACHNVKCHINYDHIKAYATTCLRIETKLNGKRESVDEISNIIFSLHRIYDRLYHRTIRFRPAKKNLCLPRPILDVSVKCRDKASARAIFFSIDDKFSTKYNWKNIPKSNWFLLNSAAW